MAGEVTNELIYEVLKAVQTRMGNLEEGQRDLKSELRSVRTHLQAMQVDIENVYQSLGSLDLRVMRIERRLDIIDTPLG